MSGAAAQAALLNGMRQLSALLRPTLGPFGRVVAIAPLNGKQPPELLDHGATIARRMIQLADPFENMGAMLVRHLTWRQFERAGDGTATAALLALALVEHAQPYLAAGWSAVALRRGIELALATALTELRRQARPIAEPNEIAGLVLGTLRDERLAELVGDVLETVGPEGAIQVDDGYGSTTEYAFLDGLRWDKGYLSTYFLPSGEARVNLLNPRILVSDQPLSRPEQLLPALEACLQAGGRSLLVVAPEVRDGALSLLLLNRERGVLEGALAVGAPHSGVQQARALEDLAILTGGSCLRREAGDLPESVRPDQLGAARQAWASKAACCVLGGKSRREAVRQRLAEARGELRSLSSDDAERKVVQERIGRLAGLAALIRVGAASEGAQAELKLRLEAALSAGRAALRSGTVPGGGAALLACARAVETTRLTGDETAGGRVLAAALAEPARVLAENAGLDGVALLQEATERGPGQAFDLLKREWVEPWSAGLLDPLAVVEQALVAAVSAAGAVLSSEVLVRHRNPVWVFEP